MHAQSGNGWIDFNQILHIDSLGGRSDMFEATSKLVQGFGRGRGAKFRLSHWLYHWLVTLRIALLRDKTLLTHFITNTFHMTLTARRRCPHDAGARTTQVPTRRRCTHVVCRLNNLQLAKPFAWSTLKQDWANSITTSTNVDRFF